MSLKAGKGNNNSNRVAQEPLAAENYMARLVQVIDMGVQEQRPWQGKEKEPAHTISVTYELVSEFCKDENGEDVLDKPRWISEEFPLYSLQADKAKSTKRYLVLDPRNEHEGDWSALVGTPCLVTVTQYNKQKGGIGNGVGGITPPLKGFEVPDLVNTPKIFDLDEPDLEVFNALPEWLRDKIKSNLNYKGSPLETALEGTSSAQDTDEEEDDYDEIAV